MHSTLRIGSAAGALLLFAAGWVQAEGNGVAVPIKNFLFGPGPVVISRGQSVTWSNGDQTPHNIIATDRSFRSPPLDTGESFSRVFNEAGTFDYICGLHPQMKGRVVVTP